MKEGISLHEERRQTAVHRGRRSGTRTPLQERQKLESREKILDAASRLFSETSFFAATIDGIAGYANLSRVTVYKHFESKIAVAEALSDRSTELMIDDYASLAKSPNPSREDIKSWVRHILSLFTKHRELVRMMASITWQEPSLLILRAGSYARIIEMLGQRIPAFRAASSGNDEKARIKAHLLFVQLNELCFELALSGWQVNHDDAVAVITDDFAQFIENGTN
jgi:AcrR family transcriptional regulator